MVCNSDRCSIPVRREMALDTLREVTYVCPSLWDPILWSRLFLRENIHRITGVLDPKDDCMTISAVHDRIDNESTERRNELEKAHVNMKGTPFLLYRAPCLVNQICSPAVLARVLDAARTSSTRPPGVPSTEQHTKNLNHLDTT